MGKQITIFIVETRLLTLRRSSHCSLDLSEHRIAQMRPMVLTIKSKIPLLSAKNQMVQHSSGNSIPKFRCTLFLAFETGSRKIVYHLIISPFSSLLRVRVIRATSAVLIKKIGKRFENGERHPSSCLKNPYHY